MKWSQHVQVCFTYFFANAPQLRKALLKFGKRWSVVRRARHRRQLSVVIALSQEMGIFSWHLIKPLPRLIQNASRIILWRFHRDDFSSSCGKRLIFFLQVSLFCPKIISESGFMDIVDDIRVIMTPLMRWLHVAPESCSFRRPRQRQTSQKSSAWRAAPPHRGNLQRTKNLSRKQ